MVYIGGAIFIAVFLFVLPLLFFVFRGRNLTILGRIFAALHLIAVLVMGAYIYHWLKMDGQAYELWVVFYCLDMPSSVLVNFATLMLFPLPYNFMLQNYFLPLIMFAIFGTVQYYYLGICVGMLYQKLWKKRT